MAETAAILSPQKTVLIPDLDAGCSLAASISAEQLRVWKAENPGAVVVSYVNTTAEVKAESDYCCTSGNAKSVIANLIFGYCVANCFTVPSSRKPAAMMSLLPSCMACW